jgi:hypothetical protein
MQEEPESFIEKFNTFFTTPRLALIFGLLLGVIASRLLGFK